MSNRHAEQLRSWALGMSATERRVCEVAAAEIDRLRALVEAAYREGYREGALHDTSRDGFWNVTECANNWAESKARSALDSQPD